VELKWEFDPSGSELMLTTPGDINRHGFVEAFEKELSNWDGVGTLTLEYKIVYKVEVSALLRQRLMPCEKQEFVTLRKAMRALKKTVTVLLIGRGGEIMTNYHWRFVMGTKKEPTWEVRNAPAVRKSFELFRRVAYARRAKDAGWFVQISGVNGDPSRGDEKLYIGDDVFPPSFMIAMLGMNKLTN